MTYIHNYWKNPKFYDAYDYDWENRDPGSDGEYIFVDPIRWNTDEIAGQPILAPHRGHQTPPFYQVSLRRRRYNNIIVPTFEMFGWESGWFDGVYNINSFNPGWPCVYPITETHFVGTRHFIAYDDDNVNDNYKTWPFMNQAGEKFWVTRKEVGDMTPAPGNPPFEQNPSGEGNSLQISNFDRIVLEVKEIRGEDPDNPGFPGGVIENATFTSIGSPPINKMIDLVPSIPDVRPAWGLDPQGRVYITYTGSQTAMTPTLHSAIMEYHSVHTGDSGTPFWNNTVNHGFVFRGLDAGGRLFDQSSVDWFNTTFGDPNTGDPMNLSIEYISAPETIDEIIDYYEHPGITENEHLPYVPGQTIKAEIDFTDAEDYTIESNEVSAVNSITNYIIGDEDFLNQGIYTFSYNTTEIDSNHNNLIYSGMGRLSTTGKYQIGKVEPNDCMTRETYEYLPSGRIKTGVYISGLEVPILVDQLLSDHTVIKEDGNYYFKSNFNDVLHDFYLDLMVDNDGKPYNPQTGESIDFIISFEELNLHRTFPIGTLVRTTEALNPHFDYDKDQFYSGNEVTFTLRADNIPIPPITLQVFNNDPDTLFRTPLILMEYVSNTEDTLTMRITGAPGEVAGAIPRVWWGYDEGLAIELSDISTIVQTILSPPAFNASAETTNPEDNLIARTYDHEIQIITDPSDVDIVEYNWNMSFNPLPEI